MGRLLMHKPQRRSAIRIMSKLIVLIKPLLPVMALAVAAGVLGFLCAIFIPIISSHTAGAVLEAHTSKIPSESLMRIAPLLRKTVIALLSLAILRGVLHCIEQYCNHYIAFKLLALIRHNVFTALRKLAPAKLEGKDKGNLISLITIDIELLEVFYAHTISPIIIAVLTSLGMLIFIGSYSLSAAGVALAAYCTVGIIIPLHNGKKTADTGMAFRNAFGNLTSFALEALRGLDEIIQYNAADSLKKKLADQSALLAGHGAFLSEREAVQRAQTHAAVLIFGCIQLILAVMLCQNGSISFSDAVVVTVALMSSFGPVLALAQLSNNLHQTLASGERVLSLLEETPLIAEIPGSGAMQEFTGVQAEHIGFAYDDEPILSGYSAAIQPHMITGIHGASGSGKSTLLKLMMRFWDIQSGKLLVSGEPINMIPTQQLRDTEGYVTQESHLFKGTIAGNIKLGKPEASMEEVIAAAKKASIHEFISALPSGYDTPVGELGETLSGGERQRIGLARAFLHDAPLLLLDEPTSNVDALNEKIILKSLKEAASGKTVVLVSHRRSTLNIADTILTMEKP